MCVHHTVLGIRGTYRRPPEGLPVPPSIAEVVAHLMRHDSDQPITVQRAPDGEQHGVVAVPELFHLLGHGVKQDIPELPVDHGSLEVSVRSSHLADWRFAVVTAMVKDMLL